MKESNNVRKRREKLEKTFRESNERRVKKAAEDREFLQRKFVGKTISAVRFPFGNLNGRALRLEFDDGSNVVIDQVSDLEDTLLAIDEQSIPDLI